MNIQSPHLKTINFRPFREKAEADAIKHGYRSNDLALEKAVEDVVHEVEGSMACQMERAAEEGANGRYRHGIYSVNEYNERNRLDWDPQTMEPKRALYFSGGPSEVTYGSRRLEFSERDGVKTYRRTRVEYENDLGNWGHGKNEKTTETAVLRPDGTCHYVVEKGDAAGYFNLLTIQNRIHAGLAAATVAGVAGFALHVAGVF